MDTFHLLPVGSPDDLLHAVAAFNTQARRYPDRARSLLRTTRYWVYHPQSGRFGPGKFVGYVGMTFDGYELGHQEATTGSAFQGGVTRAAIQTATGQGFRASPDLTGRLVGWGTDLLGADAFGNADREKWRFVVLDAEEPEGPAADLLRGAAARVAESGYFDPAPAGDERERALREVVQRRGQPEFRARLLAAYGGRCAITGCDAAAALEAAHLDPYTGPDSQRVTNGLLLRSDIHTLFDLDLIGIDPATLGVALAPAVRATTYADLHGVRLRGPADPAAGPDPAALARRWRRFAPTDHTGPPGSADDTAGVGTEGG